LNECLRKIKELRKRFISREVAEREKESLVEQEALILEKGIVFVAYMFAICQFYNLWIGRVPQLVDVSIRPFAGKGKLNSGILEAHSNGFRYKAKSGFVVDILYRNIK
jgi:nucleosome binding factor SPN SPT16 subunit